MLRLINQKTKGWFSAVILTLIALTFIFYRVEATSRNKSKVILKIGKMKFTDTEFERQVDHYKTNLLAANKGLIWNEAREEEVKAIIIKEIVEQTRLMKTLHQLRLTVGAEEILDYLVKSQAFNEKGTFSSKKLREYLTNYHISWDYFRQNMFLKLGLIQQEQALAHSEFFLPQEKKLFEKSLRQERKVKLVDLSSIKKEIVISEEEKKAYYKQHEQDFQALPKVNFEYVTLDINHLKIADCSKEEAYDFYEENLHYYTQPKAWKVLLVETEQLDNSQKDKKENEKFEIIRQELAKEGHIASVAGVKPQVALLTKGSIHEGMEPFLEGAKIGEVFETPIGGRYFFVKVLAIEAEKVKPFEEVASHVAVVVKQRNLTNHFTKFSDQLAELTYNNPENLEVASNQLNLTIKESGWQTKAEVLKEFGSVVSEQVFDSKFLAQKINSGLLEIAQGKLMVVRVKDFVSGAILPFEQVKAQIDKVLYLQLEKAMRLKLAEEFLVKNEIEKTFKELVKKYQLKVELVTFKDNLVPEKWKQLEERVFGSFDKERLFFENPWLGWITGVSEDQVMIVEDRLKEIEELAGEEALVRTQGYLFEKQVISGEALKYLH